MPLRAPLTWAEFRTRARPLTDWSEAGLVLCLDPGETTGWALFADGELDDCGQEPTGSEPALMADFINSKVAEYHSVLDWPSGVEHIVYEEYRIRGSKAKQHVGSEVVTIQHIGVIRATADQLGIPLVKQSAGMAKGFASDEKLRRWGLYQTNKRHANDAIRHGVYWHLFGFRKDPHGTRPQQGR